MTVTGLRTGVISAAIGIMLATQAAAYPLVQPDCREMEVKCALSGRLEFISVFGRIGEEDALMFEALDAYCKRNNIKIFSLHLRLSQEKVNAARWDEAFISQEIRKHGVKNIQRVWVCGPPVMNETFDRVFSAQPANGASVQEGEPLL